jgi:hypothetical protein
VRRSIADAGDVPRPPQRAAATPGPIGREALNAATAASCSTAKREALDATERAVPLDVPCRCAGTDAGSANCREALDAAAVASGARIKPVERGEALHREPLNAGDVPCRSTCPAASCPGGRGPMGCFGIEN